MTLSQWRSQPRAQHRPPGVRRRTADVRGRRRVRVRLLRELAASGESLVATHLSFPSVCRVAVAGDAFRFVPAVWDY